MLLGFKIRTWPLLAKYSITDLHLQHKPKKHLNCPALQSSSKAFPHFSVLVTEYKPIFLASRALTSFLFLFFFKFLYYVYEYTVAISSDTRRGQQISLQMVVTGPQVALNSLKTKGGFKFPIFCLHLSFIFFSKPESCVSPPTGRPSSFTVAKTTDMWTTMAWVSPLSATPNEWKQFQSLVTSSWKPVLLLGYWVGGGVTKTKVLSLCPAKLKQTSSLCVEQSWS